MAPERLIRASLLHVRYTIRSERQRVEQIQYDLPFRWFVGPEMDDRVWHPSTFSKNRERLFDPAALPQLFAAVRAMARTARRWVATRATTRAAAWHRVGRCASHRTWR